MLENIWHDILYAARGLQKNPVFAAAAILTLALGVGGDTAIFTIIHAVLLKPLAYPEADRLVQISGGATPTRFEDLKAAARSFTGVAAYSGQEDLTLDGSAEPEIIKGVRVSYNFLEILEVNPVSGRSFRAVEDSPSGSPVVMISDELWNRRFNRDPQAIGKTLLLSATPCTIVGTLPPRFQFPFPGIDAWMTRPSEWPLMPAKSRLLSPFLTVFGRLEPQLSLEQANAELAVLGHRYATAHRTMLDAKPKKRAEVKPLKEQLVATVRTMLWMLFGAVSFVLLITCANVASLLLARSAARAPEFAIRSALGASSRRLASQLLAESTLLSGVGGAIGVLVADWSLRAIPLMSSFELPRAAEIHLDWVVLLFAGAVSIGTGVLFGLAPSLGAARTDLISVLRNNSGAISNGNRRLFFLPVNGRSLMLIGQVALSIVLLIGTALMIESLVRLRGVDMGFNPANILTVRISLPPVHYDTDQKRAQFFQQLVSRLSTSAGVRSATAAMSLPMTGFVGSPVQDAGKAPLKLNDRPIATLLVVSPDYFRTLEIPMRRGREFTEQDRSRSGTCGRDRRGHGSPLLAGLSGWSRPGGPTASHRWCESTASTNRWNRGGCASKSGKQRVAGNGLCIVRARAAVVGDVGVTN